MELKARTRRRIGDGLEQAITEHVTRLTTVPYVKRISVVEDEKGATLWVITKAPPFDYLSQKPLLDAHFEILESSPDNALIDLRIINLSEFSPKENPDRYIPPEAKSLWERLE